MPKDLFRVFCTHIKKHHYIEAGDQVLLGVSGGVDSMVLAVLLLRLKNEIDFQFSIAHVNYQLRGKESDAQEKLVSDFSRENDIQCFVTQPALPKNSKENFQKMARDFRYHYFTEIALSLKATKVLTAHHQEDQIETILAQLLRGASLKGLKGMRPQRSLHPKVALLRPLLAISKETLIDYAKAHAILYSEDSSNASDHYWRNELRHKLLPVIKDLRPKAFQKILQFGEEMQDLSLYLSQAAKDWLKEYAKKGENSFWLPRPRLMLMPKPLRYEILTQVVVSQKGSCQNMKKDHLKRMDQICLGCKQEASYPLPGGMKFMRRGDNLLLEDPLQKGYDTLIGL